MTSVGGGGGHSALRETVCTRAECPGGHCALGHDVRGGGHSARGENPALQHRSPPYIQVVDHIKMADNANVK